MSLLRFLVIVTSSFFFVGYLPFIPGTFGSFAAIVLFCLVWPNSFLYICIVLVALASGFLVGAKAEKIYARKDPPCVVIDEVAGMLLALAFLPSYKTEVIVTAFLLFRLLDTFKPYPADRLQLLGGSLGIMSDDLIAAFYTNFILQAALRLTVFKGS
ncbi:MAG: phosphatidylglycerophosphatase A [Candidatus Omnitrophica bacterium]|nr:phosphatidylglycerophosphatase A [Candidatus Omnitrophota bacterium]